jgi:hypothetical protein
MIDPATIPEPVAEAAIDTILKPLGTRLRHYMPVHKAEAIKAMQGVLAAERDRVVSEVAQELYALKTGDGDFGGHEVDLAEMFIDAIKAEERA